MSMASMWACQFNREAMRLRKGRGGLHHIALTTKIEQIVDWAFAMSHSPEMMSNHKMVVEILKARRSELKAWLLEWRLRGSTDLHVLRDYRD